MAYSTLADIENNRTNKCTNIAKIASALGVSPLWLESGTTPMPGRSEAREPAPEYVAISRVLLKLEAGVTGYEIQQIDGNGAPIFFRRDFLEKKGWRADRLFALKVSGDSMEPALYAGDLVVINADEAMPSDGDVFVVNYEGQIVIKRLRRDAGIWWLDSDNPRYKPKQCDEHAAIIGRVISKQSEVI